MYQHLNELAQPIGLPVTRALCVGRNYLDHVQELNNEVPDDALLFMKPQPALCHMSEPIVIPDALGACHNELELTVLLKAPLCKASKDNVLAAIWGVGLGLDLTLRDVQSSLKAKGYPWERAKAFDFSCPLSCFIPVSQFSDLQDITFSLHINGDTRQQGNSKFMIRPMAELIAEMSHVFSLQAGDVILTGTPKGVGPLHAGDSITAALGQNLSVTTSVVV
ncbi:fumarylacetoacetate hydrolase family protein [Aestuariibacter sp. A3R04]|uniref:fumarylacetoacetate hydrolase family protein n=1 Tax=Aestuariibacter sp. A3R04 TaxID=2841571 RepID=UPI001C098488|nr:fumarylacetoacetate hydrolase family protein [Aestuariibacter sp. A3R04]MBU3023328.1 fumarylacetoacetate hydrolase family protein [Aestuariibacter sp. A3R04]